MLAPLYTGTQPGFLVAAAAGARCQAGHVQWVSTGPGALSFPRVRGGCSSSAPSHDAARGFTTQSPCSPVKQLWHEGKFLLPTFSVPSSVI